MTIKVLASGSRGNCYVIEDGESTILLDAGIPIMKIREGVGFKLTAVAGALITHRHGDHAKAVKDLTHAGTNVYASEDVFESAGASGHRCKVIKDGIIGDKRETFTVGSFRVLPFSVHHDVPNLGFYIHSTVTGENLLYFTDTYYISHVFSNLNYIMAECNFDPAAIDASVKAGLIPIELKKRLMKSHMSIDTFIKMLRKNDLSGVKQIYLLHLSDNNSRAEDFKRRVQAVSGCEVYIA